MCRNKAILRVYQKHRCAGDAFYPGKGGYVILFTCDGFVGPVSFDL